MPLHQSSQVTLIFQPNQFLTIRMFFHDIAYVNVVKFSAKSNICTYIHNFLSPYFQCDVRCPFFLNSLFLTVGSIRLEYFFTFPTTHTYVHILNSRNKQMAQGSIHLHCHMFCMTLFPIILRARCYLNKRKVL
jgi:hypothetical protein